jgi:hypothetical protein
VFTLPCSEERKASFAALQLRGAALIWWENFKTIIPAGHQITWAEFKQAFKEHHIPKGLMDRKMKELLALKQGSDTVYEYAKKFNALCQYGGHHVDNDAKKIERFRDGLHGDLYERLNLYEPNSYQDLVNKAISKRMPCPKPKRIERGRTDSPLLVDQATNFALSRKVLRVLPSHLQLDTGG